MELVAQGVDALHHHLRCAHGDALFDDLGPREGAEELGALLAGLELVGAGHRDGLCQLTAEALELAHEARFGVGQGGFTRVGDVHRQAQGDVGDAVVPGLAPCLDVAHDLAPHLGQAGRAQADEDRQAHLALRDHLAGVAVVDAVGPVVGLRDHGRE